MTARHAFASALVSPRAVSEDRAEVLVRGDNTVVVVADGAGGLHGGAAASDAVIEAVRGALANPEFDLSSLGGWSSLLRAVDATLAAGMVGETTAVVVVFGHAVILGVSVGDSEAWLVTPTEIDDLTAGQHRKRLGSGSAMPTPFQREHFRDVLVVGTDGLFKYANADKIAEVARTFSCDDAAQGLVALVRLRSGQVPDDVAVVVACSHPP